MVLDCKNQVSRGDRPCKTILVKMLEWLSYLRNFEHG